MSFIGAVDTSTRLIYSVITLVFGIIILGGSILIYGGKRDYGYMITTIFSVIVFLIAYGFLGEDSPPALFISLFLGSIIGIIGGALKLKIS